MNLTDEFHPVPKPSYPKRKRSKEFPQKVKAVVRERSQGICELCKSAPAVQFHHAVYKSAGGTGDLSNCIYLCLECHQLAHSSRKVRDRCLELAMRLPHRTSHMMHRQSGDKPARNLH